MFVLQCSVYWPKDCIRISSLFEMDNISRIPIVTQGRCFFNALRNSLRIEHILQLPEYTVYTVYIIHYPLISGKYHVILDETHFKELLNVHVTPLPATVSYQPTCNGKFLALPQDFIIHYVVFYFSLATRHSYYVIAVYFYFQPF